MSTCLDCGGSECICRYRRELSYLTMACQLFTQGLGSETGYYSSLGAIKTKQAIELIKKAGVTPIWADNAAMKQDADAVRQALAPPAPPTTAPVKDKK